MKQNYKKGFTTTELLIVIGVIVILSALAIFSLTRAQRAARDTQVFQDMKTIETALEFYYTENGAYPTIPEGSVWNNSDQEGIAKDLSPFLEKLPESPQAEIGHVYTYAVTTNGEKYILRADVEDKNHNAFTNDVDGVLGGEGWNSIDSKNTVTTNASINCDDANKGYCIATE